jgi:hypothetical protein
MALRQQLSLEQQVILSNDKMMIVIVLLPLKNIPAESMTTKTVILLLLVSTSLHFVYLVITLTRDAKLL